MTAAAIAKAVAKAGGKAIYVKSLILGKKVRSISKGAFICYSLGNFCFGGNTNPADKDTMIFQQTFTFKGNKLVKAKSQKAKVVPCRLSGKSYVNDYQPKVAKGASATRIIKRLRSYSKGKNVTISPSGTVR